MSFAFQNTPTGLPTYLITGPVIIYEFVIFQYIFKEIAGNRQNKCLFCVFSYVYGFCTYIYFFGWPKLVL